MNTQQPPSALMVAETVRIGLMVTDRWLVAKIRKACQRPVAMPPSPATWWDTRPLLSEHEHKPDSVELHRQALQYGEYRGLLQRHPEAPHLVRIVSRGD